MRITLTPAGWAVALGRDRGGLLDRYVDGERDPETPLVSWEIGPLSLPIDGLSWRARLVELIGREGDRQRLLDWARSDSRIAVRYLTGSPGIGKTRLAAEIAETLQQDGWSAGFVDWRDLGVWRVGEAGAFLVLDDVPPVLDTNWLDLADAASRADPSGPKVRLLIVARSPTDERFDWRRLLWHLPDVQYLYELDRDDAAQLHARAVERLAAEGVRKEPADRIPAGDFRAWSEERAESRVPLTTIAAAFGPLDTDEQCNGLMFRLVHEWTRTFWKGDPLDVCHRLRAMIAAPTDSLYHERFLRVIVSEAIRRGHVGELADALEGVTPAALARIDRWPRAVESIYGDCAALAAALVAKGRYEPAFLEQLARYAPESHLLASRLLALEAPRIYEHHPWLTFSSRMVFAAWQYEREGQHRDAVDAAMAAVGDQKRHIDDSDSADLRRANERHAFDVAWCAAHVLHSRQAELYRTCVQIGHSEAVTYEELVLALRLLGECRDAEDGERLDALRQVVAYHRRGGSSLLLAMALEWLATLAPLPEALDALREAQVIRSGLPKAERRFVGRELADRLGQRRDWHGHDVRHPYLDDDAYWFDVEPVTPGLMLAVHLDKVRYFTASPEARRTLAASLRRFTLDPAVSWPAEEIERAHRTLWRGVCELPLFGS